MERSAIRGGLRDWFAETRIALRSIRATHVCSLPPPHPIAPLPSLPRIEFFAAEARHEFLRIRRGGKAVDIEPLLVMANAMAAQAQRQVLAEVVDGLVAAAFAGARRQRHLVRPAAVDGGRR
jgi:hypothetical protein